jgi:hypothetical protein
LPTLKTSFLTKRCLTVLFKRLALSSLLR